MNSTMNADADCVTSKDNETNRIGDTVNMNHLSVDLKNGLYSDPIPELVSHSVDFFENESVAHPLNAKQHDATRNEASSNEINVLLPIILISVTYIAFGSISAKLFVTSEVLDELPDKKSERKLLLTLMSLFLIANGSINFLFYLLGNIFRAQFRKFFISFRNLRWCPF